jgi:glycosyltransferase involved in cell wall biosynthesis
MIRICSSLSNAGFEVKLVGIKRPNSIPITKTNFAQKRFSIFFQKGFGFYLEYQIRLFFYLLFSRFDIICCIDLDTMLPVYFNSILRKKIRVYDAHEYFSQQKEVITRPKVYKVWYFIERNFVPKFKNGYTVSQSIAEEFLKLYKVNYEVIRNVTLLKPYREISRSQKIILYQGTVNEARGFEALIPAMKEIDAVLMIYGDGNFMKEARRLIELNEIGKKVILAGKVAPLVLQTVTRQAYIGVNLVEPLGLNQYYSLANKFFDYMHHGIPQITMNFPEYKRINEQFEIALLIESLSIPNIVNAISQLLNDKELHTRFKQNSIQAREVFNWQIEEQKLVQFYKELNKN